MEWSKAISVKRWSSAGPTTFLGGKVWSASANGKPLEQVCTIANTLSTGFAVRGMLSVSMERSEPWQNARLLAGFTGIDSA
jgi:hypothetical protein